MNYVIWDVETDIKISVSKITNTSQKIQNLDLEKQKVGEQK